VLEVFQRAGANLLAGFRLAKLKLKAMDRRVELLGIEHLQAAHSQGHGVIVVLAHMGPWEALNHMPHFMSKHGLEAPLASLYRPLNNAYLDKWIYQQRAAMGTQLFSRRTGFHQPVDFLRAGGLLGILSDQKMREGPRAPYFGVEVPSSPIAGLMHRRSGAPMVALSVATVGLAQWRLEFRPVAVPETTDLSSREQMAAITNHALEKSLLQSPLDGFWLHKRF
jgi:KDO2-lipid IV(A) lauroyltransferase